MTHHLFIFVAVALSVIPCAATAQEPSSHTAQAALNRVYVKIIMPTDAANRGKDRPIVESWIGEDLKKRGQAKFTAVTGWVNLDLSPLESTELWDGKLGDKQRYCQAGAEVLDRAEGRIKLHVNGWGPGAVDLMVSVTDEPGSRAMVAVDELKTPDGMPYVVVLIGPPPEKTAAVDQKN